MRAPLIVGWACFVFSHRDCSGDATLAGCKCQCECHRAASLALSYDARKPGTFDVFDFMALCALLLRLPT